MALYRSLGARPDGTRGTTALEVRKDLAALFTGPGVLPGATSPLVQGTDGFAYQVNRAGWVTSRGAGDGVHLWGNDGPLNVSTDPAPAAGLSRIDVIYALHPSADENGDATSDPVVAVERGTAASSPVAPSIPVGALELARNTMTSAATSTSSEGNTISQTAPDATVVQRARRRVASYRTSPASINNAVWTALGAWNTLVQAAGSPESDVTSSSTSYTVNFTGWARVRVHVGFEVGGGGSRFVRIMKNGTRVASGGTDAPSTVIPVTAEWEGPVEPGDVFTAEAYQSSGASLAMNVADFSTGFHIERTV